MRSVLRRIFVTALCLLLIAQTAFAYATLEKGDSGSAVLKMQKALVKIGYALVCDGDFGTDTRNTVKLFQKDHKLTVDGIAGNETLTLLYSLAESSASDEENKSDTPADSSVEATVYCADGGKLNLRKTASTKATILEQIPTGEVLTIYEKGSKWCYTNYGGEWGYVMTSFLRFDNIEKDESSSSGTSSVKATVYCADGGKLNLRKSASSSASVIKQIPNGSTLTVLSKGSRWSKVTYKSLTGYVMTAFLKFPSSSSSADKEETTTPDKEETSYVKATVNCKDGGKLNLRKSASATASVIKQIPTGTVIKIYSKGSTWCKTSYDGKDGYVMTKYLRFEDGEAPEETPDDNPVDENEGTGTAKVLCDNGGELNLRSGRGTGYSILKQIPTGETVTVKKNYGTWAQVNYKGTTGYVMTKYLVFDTVTEPDEDDKEEDTPVVTPPSSGDDNNTGGSTGSSDAMRYGEYRYATVKTASGGTLNMRKTPSTSAGKVTEIPNGAQIVVRAINGDWCDVYYRDKVGYVMTQYLVIDPGKGEYEDTETRYDTSILTRTLKSGYTGDDVELVQTRLMELGFLSKVSGTYNSTTIDAVKKFQKQHNLTVDGKAGTKTFSILFGVGAYPYVENMDDYKKEVIRYNSSSDDSSDAQKVATVTKAQTRLRELNYLCAIDGDFDEMTHDAIVDFQLRNGLVANGFLDIPTQVSLEKADAKDAASPARYYLEENAGLNEVSPSDIKLLHWADEVKAMIPSGAVLTVYDPASGLSFKLNDLSQGRHWDVEPDSLRDTLIMRKAFNGMSWDIQVVYVLLPDGSWCMATMHNRAHGTYTISDNGFGGQNCVHFLRDMSEAQKNDPSYGVRNQEVLRDAWEKLTGEVITR